MIKLVFTSQKIIEERNKLLMAWVADNLDLDEIKRQQFYKEIGMVLQYTTENEIAEYILEMLHHKKLLEDLESTKEVIKNFHNIAYDQLSNTKGAM